MDMAETEAEGEATSRTSEVGGTPTSVTFKEKGMKAARDRVSAFSHKHAPALALTAAAVTTCVVRFAQAPTDLRAPVVFAFAMFAPGAAFVPLLGLGDRCGEFALAIAVSLSCDVVLALTMAYAHVWSPDAGLVILAGLTVAGGAMQVAVARASS
jgi:hypothetical protein